MRKFRCTILGGTWNISVQKKCLLVDLYASVLSIMSSKSLNLKSMAALMQGRAVLEAQTWRMTLVWNEMWPDSFVPLLREQIMPAALHCWWCRVRLVASSGGLDCLSGRGIVRKYVSFKECDLGFVLYCLICFLEQKEQAIPKFPGWSFSSKWFDLERIEGKGLATNPRCVCKTLMVFGLLIKRKGHCSTRRTTNGLEFSLLALLISLALSPSWVIFLYFLPL